MIRIRFWWPGYSPEDALTTFAPAVLEMPFDVSTSHGEAWRSPQNGASLETIHEWMIDHGHSVVDTVLVDERRNGRWEGQYVLTIGPKQQGR